MNIWQELTDSFEGTNEIDEMKKKYENTYLLLRDKDSDKDIVVLYAGFEGTYHKFIDEHNVTLTISHNTNYKIYNKFPERLLFNYGRMACEFIRQPTRQYRRGICKDNVSILNPVRALWVGTGASSNHQLNHKNIKAALKPTYPMSCEDAINALDKQSVVSVALNKHFMLSLSFTGNDNIYYLWYSNKCIGEFVKDKFYLKNPVFKQEVLENLNLFTPYQMELM